VSSNKLRFDGWILDPESGELERNGARIRLQEQPVQVLRELIAQAGSVVPRERLIALLWPKRVVDFDTALNTVVRRLRSALGDTSETPRYIETLPRRGYRFIGALDPDPEATSGASAALPVSTPYGASLGPVPPLHQGPTVPPEAGLAAPRPMPSGHDPGARDEATSSTAMTIAAAPRPRLQAVALIAALAVAALLTGVYALWRARSGASITSAPVQAPSQSALPANVAPTSAVAFSPPPHSIAVLPFVNMSGDKEQDYFSDGLSEELLNDLSRINELQVAARTSSFSFKGKDTDIGTIARKLNVGAVLEGSVRRSTHTVRITAQLNNAMTGFHMWSQTYDRELGDVLKLETEIASAVASALKVTLLRDVATEMKVGGTRNPAAYDAYLRSASAYWQVVSASDNESVRAGYQEAVRLDPNFALAYAEWSIALSAYAELFAHGPAVGDFHRQARAPALKAVALAPELAEGHLALAVVYERSLDLTHASDELQRAMTLAPGNARVLRDYGGFAVEMGRTDAGIAAVRRAAALDPLSVESYGWLSDALRSARRYDEALAAYQDGLSLQPKDPKWPANGQLIYYALGDFEKMRAVCEGVGEAVKDFQDCLALAYHELGRQADAETALARFKALEGNAGAYGYATIYAEWGNTREALTWLETALQLRDPQLINLKTEPLLDPLRKEPRFLAIERELGFPD
jgi:TolB-like protein/DNA-binding winged helix-turn-helix (wHTH) protein/Tfp pilus assembly protein PilF